MESFTHFIFAFSTLISLINPVGLTPVYLSLVQDYPRAEQSRIALKSSLTATITLLIFAVMGELIFAFFGITIEAFRIAGGILFFRIGIQMLDSKVPRTKSTPQEEAEAQAKEDVSITPIGVPLIAGPGAITSVMILSSESDNLFHSMNIYLAISAVMAVTCIVLYSARYMTRLMGVTGMRITQRIMGLLLIVISVQFIINGVTPVVQNWFTGI